jgi:hypothetical protein
MSNVVQLHPKDNNKPKDNIEVTGVTENTPRKPETEEEKELYNKIQAQAETILNGDNPLNMSQEDLDKMGITSEQLTEQMAYYNEQQRKQQANQVLGQVFAKIQEENPDKLPDMILYDELLEHMLNIVSDVMDKTIAKAYDELAVTMIEILDNEVNGKPYLPFEERLESKALDIDKNFFDNTDEVFIAMNGPMKDQIQSAEYLEKTTTAFKLIEFAVNTNMLTLSKEDKKQLVELIAIPEMQQSIMLCKTTNSIIDKVLSNMPSLEFESAANKVIDSIFPRFKSQKNEEE